MKSALAFTTGVLLATLSAGPSLVRAGQSGTAGHAMPGLRAAPGSFQALMDEAMARMDAGMSSRPPATPTATSLA